MSINRTFLMLSGGPGIRNLKDKEHDISWANYVNYPLNLAYHKTFPAKPNEQVVWAIFKPAFEKRWADDVKHNRSSVKEVKAKGFNSYVQLLEARAKQYGWTLKWIGKGSEFWEAIRKCGTKPVSRFWYFGHAQDNLWLTLEHNRSNTPVMPSDPGAVIWKSDIKADLAPFISGGQTTYDSSASTKIFGCNTGTFAKQWAVTYNVYAEGAVGTLDFGVFLKSKDNHTNLATGCTWVKYKPDGGVL